MMTEDLCDDYVEEPFFGVEDGQGPGSDPDEDEDDVEEPPPGVEDGDPHPPQ